MTNVLNVDIRLEGIEINGQLFPHPVTHVELGGCLDEEASTYEISKAEHWRWRKSGVSTVLRKTTLGVTFSVQTHNVRIEGQPIQDHFGATGPTYAFADFGNGQLMAHRSQPGPDQQVIEISVEQKIPRGKKKQTPAKPVPLASSAATSDAAEFADLNFKLLVVQALMYDTDLLAPRFSLDDFLEEFSGRDIDIEVEGHAPIPEALSYFEALPVPQALLAKVDEIYQDGGNEIYAQIAPLWGGEDQAFDIADFRDVDLMPNLRSITLIDTDEATLHMLREKGIDADLL